MNNGISFIEDNIKYTKKRIKKINLIEEDIKYTESPSEKERTIKFSLKRICKSEKLIKEIHKNVEIMNEITTRSYLFLNLHIRRLIEENIPIPKLKHNYLINFFQVVSFCSEKSGRKVKIDNEIENTYIDVYLKLCSENDKIPDRAGLGHSIGFAAIEMATSIGNNIEMYFFERQVKYLKEKTELKKFEIIKLQNRINKTPRNELNDIEKIYFDDIVPKNIIKNIPYYLKSNPEKFLEIMYKINSFLEENDKKTFSILPLRRAFVPKNIRIDTANLEKWALKLNLKEVKDYRELYLNNKNKEKTIKKRKRDKYGFDMQEEKNLLWSPFFNIDHMMKHSKQYKFSYSLVTDGISAGVLMHKGKPNRKKKKAKKEEIYEEFPNKDDIDAVNIDAINIVGVDPGKNSMVYMTSDGLKQKHKNWLQYTNVQRKSEIGTKDAKKKLDARKTARIIELETKMTETNSRSSSVLKFSKYVKIRLEVGKELSEFYTNKVFRFSNWRCFRKKQKSESKFINKVKEKFGKDAILGIGNWNRKSQMKGCIPSPTSGLRNLLSKHFEIIIVPEHKTTITCFKCEKGIMKSCLKRPRKGKENMVDVRGLRKCNSCGVFMNRDYNAALNIRKNLIHKINNKEWHPIFSRKSQSVVDSDHADNRRPNTDFLSMCYTV